MGGWWSSPAISPASPTRRWGRPPCKPPSTTGPRLTEIADALEVDRIVHGPFDAKAAAAPLPRAFQWADGSAYVNHVALVRKARGVEVPASFWTDPLMYQGGSDVMLG